MQMIENFQSNSGDHRAACKVKACTKCDKEKQLEHFPPAKRKSDGRSSWCRTCVRIGLLLYHQTDRYREVRRVYRSRPDVRLRERAAERKHRRTPRYKAKRRRWRQTLLYKLRNCRSQARQRLKKVRSDERTAALNDLIAQYESEIRRVEAAGE